MLLRYGILIIMALMLPKLYAQDATVVITEVMYNPPESNSDSLEFIEIYNASEQSIDLEGFYFEGVNMTFKDQILPPKSYLLTCRNYDAFQSVYGVPALEWKSGTLTNNGETIQLFNADSVLLDSVAYRSTGDWPKEANGGGYSIVYCYDEALSNDMATSWSLSSNYITVIDSVEIYADIEIECEVATVLNELSLEREFVLNDQSFLHELESPINVKVYDLMGRLKVNQPYKEMMNFDLDRGIYLIQIENSKEQKVVKKFFM